MKVDLNKKDKNFDLEVKGNLNILNNKINFDYIKIPSVSNIIKNQSLKRDAWSQLKLLKVKINES